MRSAGTRWTGCWAASPTRKKSRRLRELLLNYEGILGIHDLVIHDYGPGRCFASVHAEVSDQCNIVAIHEIIDNAEREIGRELHMPICIHMDPIATEDETTNRVRQQMNDFLREIDPALSMHDFRMVMGQDRINLIFDVVVPADYTARQELIRSLNAYAARWTAATGSSFSSTWITPEGRPLAFLKRLRYHFQERFFKEELSDEQRTQIHRRNDR